MEIIATVTLDHHEIPGFKWHFRKMRAKCGTALVLAESGEGEVGFCGTPAALAAFGQSLVDATSASELIHEIFSKAES